MASDDGIDLEFKRGSVWLITILAKADREWADVVQREAFLAKGITSKYQLALAFVLTSVLEEEGHPREQALVSALADAAMVDWFDGSRS